MSLKELLGEELYNQVKEKIGDKELIINNGSFVPRERLNEAIEQRDEYKSMLDERNNQLEELKKKAQGNEELQAKIQELQSKNEETIQQYESKLAAQKFDFELEKALRDVGARNPKAVKALLNTDEIKLEDGKLVGLDAQLENLKKTDDYLFGDTGLKGKDHEPGDGKADDDYKDNPWEKGKVNLTKQGEILKNDPDKARSLIKKAGLDPAKYGL